MWALARLAALARTVRPTLARAVQPHRAVWLCISGPAAPHPVVGPRRADDPVRGRVVGAGQPRVQRNSAVPRAVPPRPQTTWVRRCEDRTDGPNDSRGNGHLDRGDR